MEEPFVNPEEVSELTGITIGGLATLRYQGNGPKFYRPTPRTILYRRSEVIAWIEASALTRTSEPVNA